MESWQAHAKIQRLPQQCTGLNLWDSYAHPCLFLAKPPHHRRGTWVLGQLPLPLTEYLHCFSTLQWFGYIKGKFCDSLTLLKQHRLNHKSNWSCGVILQAELERGEAASSIPCYMRESGASEEGAYKHIFSLLNETWKKMNKDRVSQSPFPKAFVETAINLARNSHCFYQFGDGLGAPDSTAKNRIRSLIIEPIALYEMEISTSS